MRKLIVSNFVTVDGYYSMEQAVVSDHLTTDE
jgi:hypothetical protein